MRIARRFAFAFGLFAPAGIVAANAATPSGNFRLDRHLAMQVTDNDPARMNMALNNLSNVFRHYTDKAEEVEAELVAYGPGLHMFRADTSPVKGRIASLLGSLPGVVFSACGNTMEGMRHAEGKEIVLIEGVRVTPSGVVRLMELQEQGWSYVRP